MALYLILGEDIEQGDKRLLLAVFDENNNDVIVTPGNVDILVNGTEYKVVGVGEVNPAGISILFDLHVRR
jgi:hypothetical protein